MRRTGYLALACLLVWALLALPAGIWLGSAPPLVSLAAAGICLVPASLTLLLSERLRKRTTEEKVVAALVAPFIRMILSGGGGMWAYFEVPLIRENGFTFITWMVVFYLATLAVETRLLYIDTTASAAAEISNR